MFTVSEKLVAAYLQHAYLYRMRISRDAHDRVQHFIRQYYYACAHCAIARVQNNSAFRNIARAILCATLRLSVITVKVLHQEPPDVKAALDRKGVVSGSYSNNYRGVTSIIDIIAKGIGNASNFYGRAVYYPNYRTRPPHNGRKVLYECSWSTLDATALSSLPLFQIDSLQIVGYCNKEHGQCL